MSPIEASSRAEPLLALQWAIRALAQDANTQLALFPPFVVVADELALDFEEHQRRSVADVGLLDAPARQAISELDSFLEAMSGPEHAELWTDSALQSSFEWKRVRELATAALAVAGWPVDRPPPHRAVYVGPHS